MHTSTEPLAHLRHQQARAETAGFAAIIIALQLFLHLQAAARPDPHLGALMLFAVLCSGAAFVASIRLNAQIRLQ